MFNAVAVSKRFLRKGFNAFVILPTVICAGMVTGSKAEESGSSLATLLTSEKTRYWFNSGFGPSTSQFANGGTVSFQHSNLLLSFIYDYNWEYHMFGPEPEERVYEVGIAAGTSFNSRFGTIAFSVGPTFVSGVNRGDFLYTEEGWFGIDVYEREEFHTIGFTVHSDFIFTPLPFLGIGVHGYGNLNVKRLYAGAMGCLYFGKFR